MKDNGIKNFIKSLPAPTLVLNNEGKIIFANDKISEVFIYSGIEDMDIFQLTGIDFKGIIDISKVRMIERNEKTFRIYSYELEGNHIIYFNDITSYEELKELYKNDRPCCIKVEIDNYDELIYPIGLAPRMELSSDIDKIVRNWFDKFNATINRVNNNLYVVWVEQKCIKEMIEDKFSVLDEVRNLETGDDFPASLSIGVGIGGIRLIETEEFSEDALELSLGRGGDQAVVKRNEKIEFFGGKLQAYQKNNKGKSRMIGHGLKVLIEEAKNVIISGHKYADLDSLGAALGINRFVIENNKEAYILIDEISDSLKKIYDQVRLDDTYHFISKERAKEIAKEDTLFIIVDTNRKSLLPCPELLDICDKVVLIDHHRMVEDTILNVSLSYIETYVSSASELVSEILEFMTKKKTLRKIEAEALLSGIMVDTDNFTMKTGIRTFEAAAWLKRHGADTTEVKRFFQEDFENVKLKAEAIIKASIYENGIAITTLDKVTQDAQIICAQIADQLLTLDGIRASFAIGKNNSNTVISARSLGEVNVQTIMEQFSGGGHLSVAAAQVDMDIEEVKWKILEILKEG